MPNLTPDQRSRIQALRASAGIDAPAGAPAGTPRRRAGTDAPNRAPAADFARPGSLISAARAAYGLPPAGGLRPAPGSTGPDDTPQATKGALIAAAEAKRDSMLAAQAEHHGTAEAHASTDRPGGLVAAALEAYQRGGQ